MPEGQSYLRTSRLFSGQNDTVIIFIVYLLYSMKFIVCTSVSCCRPCAMVVPDTELICEIMLVAEGFHSAKLLARKFIALYTLCKELLSKQVRGCWIRVSVKSFHLTLTLGLMSMVMHEKS